MVATIGENMTLRRASVLRVKQGVVADITSTRRCARAWARSACWWPWRAPARSTPWRRWAARWACTWAATRPEALDVGSVDTAALERERTVLADQARASGKPEEIIEKMVQGRIRKYYEEVVLLEQVWVHDGESRVKAVAKKSGADITGFTRFALGEGIEKQGGDFAAEVAAAAGL